jgi:aspartate oxidase
MNGPITDAMTIIQITPHDPLILSMDIAAIKEVVSKYAGVKKSTKGLQTGLGRIQEMIHSAAPVTSFSVAAFEANCIANVALLLFKDAAAQEKNIGVFYNESIV